MRHALLAGFAAVSLVSFAALNTPAVTPDYSADTKDYWPEPGQYPVPNTPYRHTLRSVSLEQLDEKELLPLGIYQGTPELNARRDWYEKNFYATLAAKKVWPDGAQHWFQEWQGKRPWGFAPIPQAAPPPCDQPQPTGYDAESCRYVNALFVDLAKTDPAAAQAARERVRRGRDVWFKGTFGNQDEIYLHFSRTTPNGISDIWYPWLDTRERSQRFTKYGLINDPDCTEGDASTFF